MYTNDALMDMFDEWEEDDKRTRFLRRMEHKLRAKEQRFGRLHRR